MLRLGSDEQEISRLSKCTYPICILAEALAIFGFFAAILAVITFVSAMIFQEALNPEGHSAWVQILTSYFIMAVCGHYAFLEHPKMSRISIIMMIPFTASIIALEKLFSFPQKCQPIEIE